MTRGAALLIPNPNTGLDLGVPVEVTLGVDGTPPAELAYDGERYVLGSGRGASGQWVYEHRD